ncbi:MAG: isoleucine--tRNA ligase [Candidatus Omnitrophica bacterium]|jgi:isoleucyl-tRNA synthetase|nr:isoleucine--tRNA ligase [Candidatus Omnitrophota bacterium]
MDYKSTLNLPKTDFPMKADLPKREPEVLKKWQEQDIYKLILSKTADKGKYILHDGPPYANGDIHIGHALNKTLKDIIIKYKTMRGFSSPYVPGWDCHGLPIEHALLKELKIHKSQIPQLDFRKKAHEYAMNFVGRQREQFKRLGIFGDWDNPYLTLSHEYEEAIITSFNQLVKKGYIFRGLKPVNWCYKCETALAEAEVEYEDHASPSIYVKFRLDDTKGFDKNSYLVIWTTTPWTLIANVAVAVHADFTYIYAKTGKGNLIIAKSLLDIALGQMGIKDYSVIREFSGKELEGLIYSHPFGLRKGRVVLADYVSKEDGTGLVHTAPGHGNEDYFTGVKYKLDIIMPVDTRGNFDATAGEFQGLNIFAANKLILEKLTSLDVLLFNSQIQHSYPHCWRCKSPIIFRATKQWFLSIDKNNLRQTLLTAIDKDVEWIPAVGKERISAMVGLRPDWCLSRQRYWGVPIPALVCDTCHEQFFDSGVIDKFAHFSAQQGSDSWFEHDIKDFITADISCPYCKAKDFSKGSDILDVWFDSGVSSQAVLKKRKELGGVPAELYLEGSDQHRGWFQSSLIPGVCIDAKPPFKSVLTHGFVVDGAGRKMSKSLGNVISPQDIIKDYGADILRMWVASSDYNEDIRISKEILTRLSEAYRKIRNTARFILSNLYDFNPDTDKVAIEDLPKLDKWILVKVKDLVGEVQAVYDAFAFHRAYKAVYDFCNETLSMYYLDMVKGRLYTSAATSLKRRAAQSAIYEVLNTLIKLISPILVFSAEEIWQNMPKPQKNACLSSAHLLGWPDDVGYSDLSVSKLDSVIQLIPAAAKILEEMRAKGEIGSSFDARINLLTNNQDRYTFLTSLQADLCEIFKVSQVEIKFDPAKELSEVKIEAFIAEGDKCARCWNYSHSVGKNQAHPSICVSCLEAIGEAK